MTRELPYKDFAMGMLECAKKNLLASGDLMPVVICMKADGAVDVMGLSFDGPREKDAMYKSLWAKLLPTNPRVIITVNDSYSWRGTQEEYKALPDAPLRVAYQAGDARVLESLSMVVYPRGEHAWSVMVHYDRRTGSIQLQEPEINENTSGESLGEAWGLHRGYVRATSPPSVPQRKRGRSK